MRIAGQGRWQRGWAKKAVISVIPKPADECAQYFLAKPAVQVGRFYLAVWVSTRLGICFVSDPTCYAGWPRRRRGGGMACILPPCRTAEVATDCSLLPTMGRYCLTRYPTVSRAAGRVPIYATLSRRRLRDGELSWGNKGDFGLKFSGRGKKPVWDSWALRGCVDRCDGRRVTPGIAIVRCELRDQ